MGSQRDIAGIPSGYRRDLVGIPQNPEFLSRWDPSESRWDPGESRRDPDGIPTISRSNPTKSRQNPVGIWAGSQRDLGGIPAGSQSGSRVFIPVDPTGILIGIPVGSHRDSHPFFHLGAMYLYRHGTDTTKVWVSRGGGGGGEGGQRT